MTNLEIVRVVVSALEAGDMEELRHYLAPNFHWESVDSDVVLDMQSVISVHRLLLTGFPDWQFNMRSIIDMQDRFRIHFQATGTHTGILDVTKIGFDIYQPTGRFVIQPAESFDLWLREGRVEKMVLNADPDGGFPGIVRQLTPQNREYWKNLVSSESVNDANEK